MWITKLKLKHADCPIVNRCKKFHLLVYSYPSTWYEDKKQKYATTTCFFLSREDALKEKFLSDLKADKRITKVEVSGDMFTYEIKLASDGEHVMLYHTRRIFFVKPVVNHYDGHEYWEVAAWNKEELMQFIKSLKSHMDVCTIMKLEQSVLTDVYFPNVMPKLSMHQKYALELAYENGYYSYPRKINVQKLAKIAKVGVSTFQEHLRKAELKLLPGIIEQSIKQE
jgi:predicted DNA binding protein